MFMEVKASTSIFSVLNISIMESFIEPISYALSYSNHYIKSYFLKELRLELEDDFAFRMEVALVKSIPKLN